ncbi:MAG: response regulator transcription factor [Deltaproteobacteria bacterium]|nr:response regulator transcription factor [Deltaproteobacteria bacterium]MBW2016167.1 response regulator transcription factor [Deltaproteobacteria bacterium]MBW2130083.1 response regulator transcription factor [Deltaproteobacteria bacterium]MBW2302563.1 response regulator transcription factor [Deltaproteobacteria bacterium]
MIKVMLAEDHHIVRAGLRRLVEDSGDIEVVAEAADGHEAIQKARDFLPDVAVIDISLPGLDGLEVISRLRSSFPEMPVLVLTMHEEEQYVVRATSVGAAGYVTKRSAPEELVEAIRKVHAGGRFLSEPAAEALAERVARGKENPSPLDLLSNREIQVLRCLALGKTNREIAEIYGISVKTVDTYRSRLLGKLKLRNNAELSRFAIQQGIVEA